MSFLTNKESSAADEPVGEIATGARLLPRITIQAFCEHSQTAQLVESAVHDRRMSKVALTTHNGGLEGAVESYKSNPTPNLIIVETTLAPGRDPRCARAPGRSLRRLDPADRPRPCQRRHALSRADPLGRLRIHRPAHQRAGHRQRHHRALRRRRRSAHRPHHRLYRGQGRLWFARPLPTMSAGPSASICARMC